MSYPTSCAPQAWAAASPLHLLRSLCRFDPSIPSGRVWCDPVVPERFLPLVVEGLRIGGTAVTFEIHHDGWRIEGLPDGVELIRSPRPPATTVNPAVPGEAIGIRRQTL